MNAPLHSRFGKCCISFFLNFTPRYHLQSKSDVQSQLLLGFPDLLHLFLMVLGNEEGPDPYSMMMMFISLFLMLRILLMNSASYSLGSWRTAHYHGCLHWPQVQPGGLCCFSQDNEPSGWVRSLCLPCWQPHLSTCHLGVLYQTPMKPNPVSSPSQGDSTPPNDGLLFLSWP